MDFRYDLFDSAMGREATRVYEAEHLSEFERIVFCRMIQLARYFVVNALPYPMAGEEHLPPELLERLRQTLAELNEWQMEKSRRAGHAYVDYTLALAAPKGAGTVVPFRR
jgi:uncharacterized membrane protein